MGDVRAAARRSTYLETGKVSQDLGSRAFKPQALNSTLKPPTPNGASGQRVFAMLLAYPCTLQSHVYSLVHACWQVMRVSGA